MSSRTRSDDVDNPKLSFEVRQRFQSFKNKVLQLRPSRFSRRQLLIWASCLFLLAAGVRLLHWQNSRLVVSTIMSGLTARYLDETQPLIDGELMWFIRGGRDAPDPGILMHPPGYSMVIAAVNIIAGKNIAALRAFNVLCGAVTVVLVMLLAAELLPRGAAILAGVLVAISPQLSFYSLVLLPDSITLLPIVLSIYLLARALRKPHAFTIVAAGIAIGISCWLRPNMLLLAPLLGVVSFGLFPRAHRFRYAGLLVVCALLVIAPILIRNAIVFRSFVPLAIGTGHNLLVGMADYDPERRLGLDTTDDAVYRREAVEYQRPDYAYDLYRPDGIERDRDRVKRARALILNNKLWFAGVMARRGLHLFEYENVSIISAEPSVTNSFDAASSSTRVWSASAAELTQGTQSSGPNSGPGRLDIPAANPMTFRFPPLPVQSKSDYLLTVAARVDQGEMMIRVVRPDTGKTLASAHLPNSLEPSIDPNGMRSARLTLVNDGAPQVQIEVSKRMDNARTVVQFGSFEMYRLGPAGFLWTKYPRLPLKRLQRFFTTGWMAPLALIGVLALALARRFEALALILAVPAYFVLTHPPLHLELRYVLPLHCFWALLVATSLYFISMTAWYLLQEIRRLAFHK